MIRWGGKTQKLQIMFIYGLTTLEIASFSTKASLRHYVWWTRHITRSRIKMTKMLQDISYPSCYLCTALDILSHLWIQIPSTEYLRYFLCTVVFW